MVLVTIYKQKIKKNPGGREAAAARGTKVHSLMEEYLLGIDKDPQIESEEIAEFWDGLSDNLDKLENVVWAENPADPDKYGWTMGGDGISRVWHPGVDKNQTQGWAGAPDIVAEYKGQLVLEKRAGFTLGTKDVFINITGGISVEEVRKARKKLAGFTIAPLDKGAGEGMVM